jgi:hypothetical protein
MSDTNGNGARPERPARGTFPTHSGTPPTRPPGGTTFEIDISLGAGNRLYLKGEGLDLTELDDVLQAFFQAAGTGPADQPAIDALKDRVQAATGALEAKIHTTTPEESEP